MSREGVNQVERHDRGAGGSPFMCFEIELPLTTNVGYLSWVLEGPSLCLTIKGRGMVCTKEKGFEIDRRWAE